MRDPHVRWCERGRLVTAPYSISLFNQPPNYLTTALSHYLTLLGVNPLPGDAGSVKFGPVAPELGANGIGVLLCQVAVKFQGPPLPVTQFGIV
jgi:hypothetical protein